MNASDTPLSIDALNARFAIAGLLSFAAGQGQLPCANITSAAGTARIYLHGAHITHWQPAGHEPILFLSDSALFAPGKAIRGGIPICHPWFGPATIGPYAGPAMAPAASAPPAHGLVRTLPWQIESTSADAAGNITITLAFHTTPQTRALWPFDFSLRFGATFGQTLATDLQTVNTGSTPMPMEEALHTYLAVADVRRISITGLDGAQYLDKTDHLARKRQSGPITFTAETDRAYINTTAACILSDPIKRRTITVSKTHSNSTIIWNPAPARAAQLSDIAPHQWPHFACIETANVAENQLLLGPGESHHLAAALHPAHFPAS